MRDENHFNHIDVHCFNSPLWSIDSFAQSIPGNDIYRVVNWKKMHGLGSDVMNVMIKDAKGFLRVGSREGGFCRSDGATFKKYQPTGRVGTINSDGVYAFVEDSLKNIRIGTPDGLSGYDRNRIPLEPTSR